jgi:class 3 adenylate cyclase
MFDRADDLRDLSDILTGFWLEGRLHTHTIPEALRPGLTARLQQVLAAGSASMADFKLTHGAETFRVFLRLLNPGSPFPLTYQIKLYSLDGALRMERKLQSVILLISLLVLALGAGISLVLANRLTRSVRELDFATAEVLRGNFQIQVPIRSRDDVGRLVDSFNQMTHGLAQKERYRRVLNLVAGTPVATQLVNADQLPAGESRRITVLFCDVRNFTALTQGLAPDQVIALLNEHMTALTRVVDEHHGFVDKFVGDLIMAVFGAPVAMENDAARAVACAHQMIAVREAMNRGAAHPLGIGIGLATGEATAGLMGSTDRANYTVLGSCVNLASRLCGEARAGEILIDAATREEVDGAVTTAPLPPLRLKGFAEPVPAWRAGAPPPTPT